MILFYKLRHNGKGNIRPPEGLVCKPDHGHRRIRLPLVESLQEFPVKVCSLQHGRLEAHHIRALAAADIHIDMRHTVFLQLLPMVVVIPGGSGITAV